MELDLYSHFYRLVKLRIPPKWPAWEGKRCVAASVITESFRTATQSRRASCCRLLRVRTSRSHTIAGLQKHGGVSSSSKKFVRQVGHDRRLAEETSAPATLLEVKGIFCTYSVVQLSMLQLAVTVSSGAKRECLFYTGLSHVTFSFANSSYATLSPFALHNLT